jgi:hypothetical protein
VESLKVKEKLDQQVLSKIETKKASTLVNEIKQNKLLSQDFIEELDIAQNQKVMEDYEYKEENEMVCK